ncbi:zinc finger MYM-type protein 1-like protein [Tanacetum coccineum]
MDCGWLFEALTNLLNVIGVSCKRADMLREIQAQKVAKAFNLKERKSGKDKNQELSLGWPEVYDMGGLYVPLGRKRRSQLKTTNDHHFRVEVFYIIIDLQLQELNTRFDEISTSLEIYTASLSPADALCSFDKQKLLKLAEFYPKELSSVGLLSLDSQLNTYTHDVSKDERFIGLKNIGELSIKLVELNKHQSFDLVYLLIKLVLILSVATASVERVFSGMNLCEKQVTK